MRIVNPRLLLGVIFCLSIPAAHGEDGKVPSPSKERPPVYFDVFPEFWKTDLEEAKKVAQKESKGILLLFTAPKSCAPCRALDNIVFSKSEFNELHKNYEFVVIDSSDEEHLSAQERNDHEKIRQQYEISGIPKMIVCDGKGRPFARLAPFSHSTTVDSYKDSIRKTKDQEKARDEFLADLDKKSDEDKIKALEDLFAFVQAAHLSMMAYDKEILMLAELGKNNPEIIGNYAFKAAQVKYWNNDFSGGEDLKEFLKVKGPQAKKYAPLAKDAYKGYLAIRREEGPSEDVTVYETLRDVQGAWVLQALLNARNGDVDGQIAALQNAVDAYPNSDSARDLQRTLAKLKSKPSRH